MQMPAGWIRALLLADLGLVFVYALDVVTGRRWSFWTAAVDVDGERNLPTLYSALQLLLLALLLWALARPRLRERRAGARALALLPALALFLALDEVTQIHEGLGMLADALLPSGTRAGTVVSRTGVWMFLLGPPLIAALALLGWSARAHLRAPASVGLRAAAGLTIYLGSALGLELLSNLVQSWPAQAAQHALEELGEMLGVTLLVWAAHGLLVAQAVAQPSWWPRRVPWRGHGP